VQGANSVIFGDYIINSSWPVFDFEQYTVGIGRFYETAEVCKMFYIADRGI